MTANKLSVRHHAIALLTLALISTISCRSNPVEKPERESFGQFTAVAEANFDERYNEVLRDTLTRLAGLVVDTSPRETMEIEGLPDPGDLELLVGLAQELTVGGMVAPVPVEDGDVLRDGVGRDEDGDRLKIAFRANRDCHVYVLGVDAAGRAWPLFPYNRWFDQTNPVQADRDYIFPKESDWLYLNELRGIMSFYFVATLTPQPELEEMLRELDARDRPLEEAIAAPARVLEAFILNRGIASVREGVLTGVIATDQTEHEIAAQIFVARSPSEGVVVTRWLTHE